MLFPARTFVLLALGVCSACAQLSLQTPGESGQVWLDSTFQAEPSYRPYPGDKALDSVIGTYHHLLASLRERLGYTLDSFSYTMFTADPKTAPALSEARMSYSQSCSLKTFSPARRSDTLTATIDKCKDSLITRRRQRKLAKPDPERPILHKGCCQARHYGVLQTCVKITLDGTDPEDIDNMSCSCHGAFPVVGAMAES